LRNLESHQYFYIRIETRLRALDNMLMVLMNNYIPESLDKWRASLIDVVERNLKRTFEEAIRVCTLAALISLQLGVGFEQEICDILTPMRQICTDESIIESVRASCTLAIALCVYLSVEVCGKIK
jgi:hypothetical protein